MIAVFIPHFLSRDAVPSNAVTNNLKRFQMAQHTTPMYRAPEMLDTWSNYPINGQADVWALGCILYYLCYLKHPFEDSAKLR